MRRLAALAFLLAAGPAWAAGEVEPPGFDGDIPVFVEEAKAAGIDHAYRGPWEFFVGGGGATFDCDGDRREDMIIAGGKGPARLFVNRSPAGGALKFEEAALDLDDRDRNGVLGAYPVDIDNDGLKDVVLLRLGANVILRGLPGCKFEKANRAFAFDGGKAWTTAFSAAWEAGATFPTLAFGNYVDRTAPGSPFGTCEDNALLRPQPGEKPDYSLVSPLRPGFCALSMLFTDWNHSGEPALRVANDRQYYRGGEEQLWRISPGLPPRLYGKADGWEHLSIWGMGIAEGDLEGDGYPEYAITSMGDTKLQKLSEDADEGQPIYRDIAWERNATAYRPYTLGDLKPSTGWDAEFADVNNDGTLDLFIAKGNVERMPDFAATDPDNLLLGRWDGRFSEQGLAAGIALPTKGRGAALADFNLDGMLDLVVVNREQPLSLFRSTGARTDWGTRPMGNWLEIGLSQDGANRDAVGATVSVKTGNRTVIRKVAIGGGHASGHLGWVHVGTGAAERAEVRIQWPDGEWSAPYRVFTGNFVLIDRKSTAARYWYPPKD
jgi:hypothetical protein